MGYAPLETIKSTLDRIFGKGLWKDWEIETISLDLGLVLDELTRDKIWVLKVLEHDPDVFYSNPLFFLYATNVINNDTADFESVALPTCLEMAYAIYEVGKMYPGTFENSVRKVMAYLLIEEGFTAPVGPFKTILSDEVFPTSPEAKKEDLDNKELAIGEYIRGMNNGIL